MNQVSQQLGVSLDAITYVLRKLGTKRRTIAESNKLVYDSKPLTFTIKKALTVEEITLETIGVTLYWGEGYKTAKAKSIDFANSDPEMVLVFINFLRQRYQPSEEKFRVYLYCYQDQNVPALIKFWSKVLRIPVSQFSKPYIRTDVRENSRKMKYGMVHLRYSDKKMLIDLLNMIESLRQKYRVGTQVVNEGTL